MPAEECTVFTWRPTDPMMIVRDESYLLLSSRFPPSVLSDVPTNQGEDDHHLQCCADVFTDNEEI